MVATSAVVFAAISMALNVTSTGFLEADGITHYLYARWALAEPHLLTNVWGRPVVTALHALPAQLPSTFLGQPLGLIGVRAMSMMLAIGGALVAWRVAVGQGSAYGHDRPALAALFMLCMPLVILHSIAELTELPFAFLAIVALWAYQRRIWWLLALTAGLLPAARPEGFGFALLTGVGLLLHRRWGEALLVSLPLIVWDRLGWWQYGGRPGTWWELFAWLRDNWPYSGDSTYESGPLFKFVGMLPAVVGPLLMPMVLVGVVASLTLGTGRRAGAGATGRTHSDAGDPWLRGRDQSEHASPAADGVRPVAPAVASVDRAYSTAGASQPYRLTAWGDHNMRVGWIIVAVPLFVLAVHSLLHWLGKMASSGDVRYLVCVAPFWALLAARGWDWLSRRLAWRYDYLWAVLAAVAPPVAMQFAYPIVPLAPDQPGRDAVRVARWYEQNPLRQSHPTLLTDHPVVWYALDLNPQRSGGGKARIGQALPGTLFLWNDVYSTHNADDRFVVPAELPPQAGWRELTPADFPAGWRVFLTAPSPGPAG